MTIFALPALALLRGHSTQLAEEPKNSRENEVHPLWWLVYIGLVLVFLFILSLIQVAMEVKFRFGALWWALIIGGCIWLARAICRRRPGAEKKLPPAEEAPQASTAERADETILHSTEEEDVPLAGADWEPAEAPCPTATATTRQAPTTELAPSSSVNAGRPVAGSGSRLFRITLLILLGGNLAVLLYVAITLGGLHKLCRSIDGGYNQYSLERKIGELRSELYLLRTGMEEARPAPASAPDYSEELNSIKGMISEISGYVYDMEKQLRQQGEQLKAIEKNAAEIEWNTEGIRNNTSRF